MSAPGKTGRERVKRRPDSRPGGRARLLRALELELVALVTRDRLLILVHRMALIAVRDTEMVIVRIGGLHLRGLSDELIPRMTPLADRGIRHILRRIRLVALRALDARLQMQVRERCV